MRSSLMMEEGEDGQILSSAVTPSCNDPHKPELQQQHKISPTQPSSTVATQTAASATLQNQSTPITATDDKQTRKELKALQDKIDILLADKATQEQLHFVGNPSQETPPVVHEVEGLEGQEELCFINNNGSWYKKEPNFQYNNYQQKSYPNNQQSGYPPRNNQQGSYQPQQNPSSGSSAPQESSTDTLLKQILESQTRSEKHVGYELKNLHSKIDGSYNELNNKIFEGFTLSSPVRNASPTDWFGDHGQISFPYSVQDIISFRSQAAEV
ncbi:hypothetical protein F2Q68_00034831 [Brassica cretica]|uniref:Uncharacterized protein n=1 Tax=Brassica cretica TaxID=69181 RepID=A0A8S9H050_BRACR|nr:hypothetical protein F2Q68_00034831 [Brassica cretica]